LHFLSTLTPSFCGLRTRYVLVTLPCLVLTSLSAVRLRCTLPRSVYLVLAFTRAVTVLHLLTCGYALHSLPVTFLHHTVATARVLRRLHYVHFLCTFTGCSLPWFTTHHYTHYLPYTVVWLVHTLYIHVVHLTTFSSTPRVCVTLLRIVGPFTTFSFSAFWFDFAFSLDSHLLHTLSFFFSLGSFHFALCVYFRYRFHDTAVHSFHFFCGCVTRLLHALFAFMDHVSRFGRVYAFSLVHLSPLVRLHVLLRFYALVVLSTFSAPHGLRSRVLRFARLHRSRFHLSFRSRLFHGLHAVADNTFTFLSFMRSPRLSLRILMFYSSRFHALSPVWIALFAHCSFTWFIFVCAFIRLPHRLRYLPHRSVAVYLYLVRWFSTGFFCRFGFVILMVCVTQT